jgi:hypothetical protein
MTISSGSTITKTDLDNLLNYNSQMTDLITDASRKPDGFQVSFEFFDLTGDVTREFVVPRDCYLESMAVQTGDMVGDVDVDLTGDGFLVSWPVSTSGTVTGAATLTRTFYDGSPSKNRDRGFRLFNQGSTLRLAVSTTNATTPCVMQVVLVLRQFYGR